MLNIPEINKVLNSTPLCGHALIAQRGMAVEYCAMGALAKSLGMTDEELRHHDGGGVSIFNELHEQLKERFGIETLNEFQNLMRTNDAAKNSATRNDEVKNTALLMSVDEIIRMAEESKLENVRG